MTNEEKEIYNKFIDYYALAEIIRQTDKSVDPKIVDEFVNLPDEEELSFLIKAMRQRIRWVSNSETDLFINIPFPMYLGIEMLSDGVIGRAILLLYKFIEQCAKANGGKLKIGFTPTVLDYYMAFPNADSYSEEKQEADWDAQKDENGKNNVDKRSYWLKLFDIQEEVKNEV